MSFCDWSLFLVRLLASWLFVPIIKSLLWSLNWGFSSAAGDTRSAFCLSSSFFCFFFFLVFSGWVLTIGLDDAQVLLSHQRAKQMLSDLNNVFISKRFLFSFFISVILFFFIPPLLFRVCLTLFLSSPLHKESRWESSFDETPMFFPFPVCLICWWIGYFLLLFLLTSVISTLL